MTSAASPIKSWNESMTGRQHGCIRAAATHVMDNKHPPNPCHLNHITFCQPTACVVGSLAVAVVLQGRQTCMFLASAQVLW